MLQIVRRGNKIVNCQAVKEIAEDRAHLIETAHCTPIKESRVTITIAGTMTSLKSLLHKIETMGIDDDVTRVVTATASSTWLLSPLQLEGRYPSHRLC